MILQQRTHLLLSANQDSYWHKSTVDNSVIDFFYKLLKKTKCMLDLVRAVILKPHFFCCSCFYIRYCFTNILDAKTLFMSNAVNLHTLCLKLLLLQIKLKKEENPEGTKVA